jgi:hypothetical protein
MALPSNGPQQPCPVTQIQDWVSATKRKRLELHLLAAALLYNTRREWAFMEMSQLLIEAIEEVRTAGGESAVACPLGRAAGGVHATPGALQAVLAVTRMSEEGCGIAPEGTGPSRAQDGIVGTRRARERVPRKIPTSLLLLSTTSRACHYGSPCGGAGGRDNHCGA